MIVRSGIATNRSFTCSAIEIERDGPSFAVDTLRTLQDQRPEADVYFITGAPATSPEGTAISLGSTVTDPSARRAPVEVGMVDDRLRRLRARLATVGKVVVAFSGGADSAFLAAVASQVLGECGRQEEPGVGHEVRIVELHGQRVQSVRGSHLRGALLNCGCRWCGNPYSPSSEGTFRVYRPPIPRVRTVAAASTCGNRPVTATY